MHWALLKGLTEDQRAEIMQHTRVHTWAKGEIVVQEGAPADNLHLIESGRLAVSIATAAGEHATVNILGPGSFFGELSLLASQEPTRSATVTALELSTTRTLSRTQFQNLRRATRAADTLLLRLMAHRIEELSQRLVHTMYDDLRTRVSTRLVELAGVYGSAERDAVVPVTQQQLAELVGATRPSVNQVLQELLADGLIAVGRGRITVRDIARLSAPTQDQRH